MSAKKLANAGEWGDPMETGDQDRVGRRSWITSLLGATLGPCLMPRRAESAAKSAFELHYVLASAMYGTMPLETILPEVKKTHSVAIDVWPAPHGNQREQIDGLGLDAVAALLEKYGTKLGCLTCYRPGPFQLAGEMELARRLGGEGVVLVTAAGGKPKGEPTPERIKAAIRAFLEKMKPQLALAEKAGCVIAIENHANDLLETPDAIRWFGDMVPSDRIGVAVAPHHLPQDPVRIAGIVRDLGPAVKFFYAQQHGMGSKEKLPKEQELLQMPGRGPLDFTPILAALKEIGFRGYTEIFMHPVPRGIPILETATAITAEILRARDYLEGCLE